MIYNNITESKYSYEVCALNDDIDICVGEFNTLKEARNALKKQNFKIGTLVTIEKLQYSPQTSSFGSSVVNSKTHSEYEI